MKVILHNTTPDFETTIADIARVSNLTGKNVLSNGQLIRRFIKRAEWSPLDMADATFEIWCSRTISRQLLRHRSFCFQEFSQRYATPDFENIPSYRQEFREADAKNRQSSKPVDDDDDRHETWIKLQSQVYDAAVEAYRWAIAEGAAPEVARAVLPEGLTISRLYMKGSARSWFHYLQVRLNRATQKEHRDVAKRIYQELNLIAPGLFNEELLRAKSADYNHHLELQQPADTGGEDPEQNVREHGGLPREGEQHNGEVQASSE
jgi:thymidylate synthase (FAD)